MIAAFPLTWPPGFPRAKSREKGSFRTSQSAALKNVQTSLTLFGRDSGRPVRGIVLSSNFSLGVPRPDDPGVAAWFTWEDGQVCVPVDRYSSIEANLQAIHHVIEARRVELRHGTLSLVRASMQGFRALPSPTGESWREVLGYSADSRVTPDQIEHRYRRLAAERHPDKPGGSTDAMARLNIARDQALSEIG